MFGLWGGKLLKTQGRIFRGVLMPGFLADTRNWYFDAHCYKVLAYDGNIQPVTLRNPWARFPEPVVESREHRGPQSAYIQDFVCT